MPKYTDNINTENEREASKSDLASTERTDAVTAKIATSADRSGAALKDPLFFIDDSHKNSLSHLHGKPYVGKGKIYDASNILTNQTSHDTDNEDFGDTAGSSLNKQLKYHGLKAFNSLFKRRRRKLLDNEEYHTHVNKPDSSSLVKGEEPKGSRKPRSYDNKLSGYKNVPSGLGQLSEKKYQIQKQSYSLKTYDQKAIQSLNNQRLSHKLAKRGNGYIHTKRAKKSSFLTPINDKGMLSIGSLSFVTIILLICMLALIILGSLAGDEEEVIAEGAFSDNERIVAEFLLEKGLEPLQVAAIMGNIEAESEFNPALIEKSTGIGHGLCQWGGDGVRLEGLYAYTKSKNKPWTDIICQLEYLWSEMTSTGDAKNFVEYQGFIFHISEFTKITDLEDAVYYFGRKFERPNENYAHWNRRIASAQKYYSILNGGGGSHIVSEAKKHLGKPYVWGAAGPNAFDCSGFVYYVYNQCGIKIGRTTAQGYYNICTKLSKKEAVPGDLVFFGSSKTNVTHIGIYLGKGKFIHAPHTGDVVKITKVSAMGNTIGYGRIK